MEPTMLAEDGILDEEEQMRIRIRLTLQAHCCQGACTTRRFSRLGRERSRWLVQICAPCPCVHLEMSPDLCPATAQGATPRCNDVIALRAQCLSCTLGTDLQASLTTRGRFSRVNLTFTSSSSLPIVRGRRGCTWTRASKFCAR